MSWLIVDVCEADQWEPRHGARVIPSVRRPSMLQPSRAVAEQEAMRLARTHPDRRFVVFEAVAAGITTGVPSHVTLAGKVFAERSVATLVTITDPDDEVPF